MSEFWKEMDEKELKSVKGTGSPCNSHGQEAILGLLGIFGPVMGGTQSVDGSGAGGSCQPAYEWANGSGGSSGSSGGSICTSR